MEEFKDHSPKQIDVIFQQGFEVDPVGFIDAVGEISIEDFQSYMEFMGLVPPISPEDLSSLHGWNIGKAKEVFSLFNKRLKILNQSQNKGM